MRGLVLLALAGCTAGASPSLGLDAILQLPDAQYLPGPFPKPTGGPATIQVALAHALIPRGREQEPLSAVLDPTARAAIVGLVGTDGAWIVPAGSPDLDTPGFASLHAILGLSDDLPLGAFSLEVAATDEDGRIGEPVTTTATATEAQPIAGTLVVGLTWSGRADLDLHVVVPGGTDVYVGHPNSHKAPPPGEPEPPLAYLDGGILDHDGNASCALDAAPDEHVVWTMPAPTGDYVVRVEAHAMCGASAASWYAAAFTDATGTDPGALMGEARGLATPDDVSYAPHGKGAGETAFGFTIP